MRSINLFSGANTRQVRH